MFGAEPGQQGDGVLVGRPGIGLGRRQIVDGEGGPAGVFDLGRLAQLHTQPLRIAGTANVPAFIVVGHTVEDLPVIHDVVDDVGRGVPLPVVPEDLGAGLGRADGVEDNAPGREGFSGLVAAVAGAEGFGDGHSDSSFF